MPKTGAVVLIRQGLADTGHASSCAQAACIAPSTHRESSLRATKRPFHLGMVSEAPSCIVVGPYVSETSETVKHANQFAKQEEQDE
jgi:hypothetical protein